MLVTMNLRLNYIKALFVFRLCVFIVLVLGAIFTA